MFYKVIVDTLHYNNINVVGAALSDIAVTVLRGMCSNTWRYLLICYLETALVNTDRRQPLHVTAVLIKLRMFILMADISLITQKVSQRQQLISLSLSLSLFTV